LLKWLNERLNEEGAAQAAPNSTRRQNDSERLGYDAVNMPEHYRRFKIEPMRYCVENGMNIFQFSINKYVSRYPHKNGVEDLKKAARCLDMAIAFEEGDPDWWRLPGERASRRCYLVD
jgi:hypothetical protein